jgi:Flp pilus assembly protein TadG
MRTRRRRPSGDGGAALIEFGIILPIFIGIFLGIVTTGLAFFGRLQMTSAAQEGARVIYLGGTSGDATSAANDAAVGTVSVTVSGSAVGSDWKCTTSGDTVTVLMERPMPIRFLIANVTVDMQAKAVTRCP